MPRSSWAAAAPPPPHPERIKTRPSNSSPPNTRDVQFIAALLFDSVSTDKGPSLTLAPTADVLFQPAPNLLDRVLHRPAGAVGQTANRRARHDADVLRHLVQDLQVLDSTLAAPHPVGDLLHPACAFTTGRTLPARLVREEPADVIQNID